MLNSITIAIRTLFFLIFITGVFYPIVVTGFSERLFPFQSGGSLIRSNEKELLGSELLAQKFTKDEYFWPRPSAADFATVASGASNHSVTNASFKAKVEERKNYLLKKHPDQTSVPPDLLFASGSGLDPHISPASAYFQVQRVATARRLNSDQILELKKLLEQSTEKPSFGFIGEKRINVLRLNLNLNSKFGR
ncbi:potassium-transporting ATPase subunit KdpC [Leptospira stimsonii]|uniref:Potassium-transporting ATPase KdpC subunit n=1 Tax=Leptospira stimsonii TaxID=2202203 RepID=A0ABY2MX65_9LEPT|nr:potassium-transporting ATPase subunit KdpC [Leptospira stimsonii]TGK20320.1 potassium-transporting ATPase subunit KdpC [Leptospira stimsonii]TGM10908.1 potassium-transporting ATPase subunit KdpC [Leptospira stimsonii]